MSRSSQNDRAQHFRNLHTPGDPLILTNVWDAITASSIASLSKTRALATASYAVAAAAGLADNDLTLDVHMRAVRAITKVAKQHNLPLTVDFQDGFGNSLEDGVRELIELGVVGINLEDFSRSTNGLLSISKQCERIKQVMSVAQEMGIPNFVVNARTDALFIGKGVDEAIERGQAYLMAGAFNVFIWGGPSRQGWSKSEVERASKALDGRLNVLLLGSKAGGLSMKQIGKLGVARISIGPALMRWTSEQVSQEAARILEEKTKYEA